AGGGRVGAGTAGADTHHFAVCQAWLRRSRDAGHDRYPQVHRDALEPAPLDQPRRGRQRLAQRAGSAVMQNLARDSLSQRLTRRRLLQGAVGAGVVWAAGPVLWRRASAVDLGSGSAPEQVHLQWGADPSTTMVVSWASPLPAPNPLVRYGP